MTDAQIQALLSNVRALLNAGGGIAVTLGVTDAAHVGSFTAQIMTILGALSVIGSMVWGMYQKYAADAQKTTVAVQAFKEGAKQEAAPTPTPQSEHEITAALNRAQIIPKGN